MSSVPINGVSFHSEDKVHKWKHVVQRCIVDEVNIFDPHHSSAAIVDLIKHAGLTCIVSYHYYKKELS